MVGVRDLDPEEGVRLGESAISVVAADAVNFGGLEETLNAPLDALRSRTDEVYLHLDVDVIDPRYAPGVGFPVEGGLSVEAVEEAVRAVSKRFRIVAASLTAYEPDADEGDKTLRAGLRLMRTVAEAVAQQREEVRHGG
jgi:arginase